MADIHAQVAENAYILYEATATLAVTDSPASEDNWQRVITECSHYVQSVSDSAEAAQLMGLRQVCLLLRERLLAVKTENHAEREAFCQELERWPRLVANYLHDPANENYRRHLVSFVTVPSESVLAENLSRLLHPQSAKTVDLEVAPAVSTIYPLHQDLRDAETTLEVVEHQNVKDVEMTSAVDPSHQELTDVETASATAKVDPSHQELTDVETTLAIAKVDPSHQELTDVEATSAVAKVDPLHQELTDVETTSAVAKVDPLHQDLKEQGQKQMTDSEVTVACPPQGLKQQPSGDSPQPQETLSQVADEVTHHQELLNNALSQFLSAEEDSDEFLQSIEEYTNSVQSLWELAEKYNLIGLQEICTFINDNVFEASSRPTSERVELQALFEAWPQLVAAYLRNPTAEAQRVVTHLQNRRWLLPLLDKAANTLLIQLMQGAVAFHTEPHVVTPVIHQKTVVVPPSAVKPEISAETTPSFSPLVNERRTVTHPVSPVVTESDSEFSLSEEEDIESSEEGAPSPAVDVTVTMPDWGEAYIEEDVALASEQVSDEALLDQESVEEEIIFEKYVPVAKEGLSTEEMLADATEIDAETLAAADVVLSDEEAFLDSATVDVDRFTDAEALPDLMDADADMLAETEVLPGELTDEVNLAETGMMADELEPAYQEGAEDDHLIQAELPPKSVRPITHPEGQVKGDNLVQTTAPPTADNLDALDALTLEITEAQNDLAKALRKVVAAQDDSTELLESIEEYVDNVQSIADAAETAGVTGLAEVCAIIKDNVLELSTEGRAIRRAAQPYIELWPKLIQVYLHNPAKGARDLVTHLSLPSWPQPLDEPRARILLRQLAPETNTQTDAPPSDTCIDTIENEATDAKLETVIASDTLALLTRQLTELLNNHTVSLNNLVRAEGDSDAFLTAVETYTESVQTIADTAEIAGLIGIQEVCTFINDNVMALNGQDKAGRLVAHDVLAKWPQWIKAYLQKPLPASIELANQLRNTHWLIPLTETQATVLQKHLVKPLMPAGTDDTDTLMVEPEFEAVEYEEILDDTFVEEWPAAIETTEVLTTTEVTPDAGPDIAPQLLEIILPQLQDTAEYLNHLLQEIMTAADESEALMAAIGSYTEHVQALWETAEMMQLTGLQEIFTFINENLMILGNCEHATRHASQSVFAEWPSQVEAYLHTPTATTPLLIGHLQQAEWPQPLDAEQAAALHTQLLELPSTAALPTPVDDTTVPAAEETTAAEVDVEETAADTTTIEADVEETVEEESSVETLPSTFVLAPAAVLELVSNQIIDVIEGLTTALEECMTMEQDNPALLESIENYTNQVQAIWDAADMAGLRGLQEVCTFVNDNLLALSAQEAEAKQAAQPYFLEWPAQILAYLTAPAESALLLVTFLQNPAWPQPLTGERATEILELLTQSRILSPEAPLKSEAAPAELDLPAVGKISLGQAEVLEILTTELESAQEELGKELQKFVTLATEDAGFAEAAENYSDQVQRLRMAAEMVGLEGLQSLCTLILDNVAALTAQELAVRQRAQGVLEAWPGLVLGYLHDPENNVVTLVKHFRENEWPQPLTDEQAYGLLEQLAQGSTAPAETEEEAAAYHRQTQALPEDVVLTIPSDINRELLAAYLQEAPQNASDFSECIQNIVQNPDLEVIKKAQRIAHTLKGSSNIIGIKGIANIAHHLEDTLEYLAKHQVAPPPALTETMIEAADCLESMVEALLGQDSAPPQALSVLQAVLDWANRIDQGNLEAPPAPSRPSSEEEAMTPMTPATPARTEGEAAAPPAYQGGGEAAAPEQTLRVPTKTIDNLMRLVGELSISIGQIQEKLKHVMGSTRLLTEQGMVIQQKTFDLENIVDVRGVGSGHYRQSMGIDVEFDPLEFEEYNELHSVTHSFVESMADSRELGMSIQNDLAELETMFIQQERLNKEFQASIMTTRMVPVNTILSKLQRNVRQTCRATGKRAELEISGIDILIDSDVLNNLADPLMHILRNSIDHGLEAPDERVLLGKPESGTIRLRFYREGNNIVVSCQDDGQGLNYTNIRYTAIQRGLIKENQEVSETDLARFILMSGFSTKSGVTQVSGRGVGMDVVHTNIRQMKGTLDLSSQTGKGLTVLIKLPMTLVTVHVLIVRVADQRFGIPTNHVERALEPGVGDIRKVGNALSLQLDKRAYAIKSLGDLLKVAGAVAGVSEEETRPIMLVREETGITAVVVDELLDTHDLVMKSMGKYVTKVHGVAGASILGDGSVVPLLDLPELLRAEMQAVMSTFLAEQGLNLDTGGAPLKSATPPYVMIVDDSLSVRKSLSILVEEAGCEPLLAKDGLEAIEIMNQTKPRVMLVDMEMPRMNGLELTAHVRGNPATQKLPIFMITSRTTEKHREQAKAAGVSAYLTKPYPEAELLDLIDKGLAGKI